MEPYRSNLIQIKASRKISDLADNGLKIIHGPSSHNDLFRRIKGLLILGKAIGIIPCEGVFQNNFQLFRYRKWSIGSLISSCILIVLGMNISVQLIKMYQTEKNNATDFARSGSGVFFYLFAAFAYFYFLRHAGEFTNLFSKWANLELQISLNDESLSRDAAIITGVIFTSAVFENLVLEFTQFSIESGNNNGTDATLRAHYQKSYSSWSNIVPYHWIWSLLAFVSSKLALYGWNFVEIFIAVCSRALSAKFRLLNEAVEQRICHTPNGPHTNEGKIWTKLAMDHSAICFLLDRFERFLSPLVFYMYGMDIYYSCLLLLLSLMPGGVETNKKSTLYTLYAAWSFFHLTIRLYIVSINAANINTHAHHTGRVLRSCPVAYYSNEVERIEKRLKTTSPIGITGLGCFTITKPFILSLIGVVFTFEIVLLQSYPQPNCCVN